MDSTSPGFVQGTLPVLEWRGGAHMGKDSENCPTLSRACIGSQIEKFRSWVLGLKCSQTGFALHCCEGGPSCSRECPREFSRTLPQFPLKSQTGSHWAMLVHVIIPKPIAVAKVGRDHAVVTGLGHMSSWE